MIIMIRCSLRNGMDYCTSKRTVKLLPGDFLSSSYAPLRLSPPFSGHKPHLSKRYVEHAILATCHDPIVLWTFALSISITGRLISSHHRRKFSCSNWDVVCSLSILYDGEGWTDLRQTAHTTSPIKNTATRDKCKLYHVE